ncbi:hypothetical protein [Ehrlichia japonica]|uniref:Putative membrane protein n=1 Tax=Ehrlichia japonica TaxID=391036 RepID=X5GKQ7_9RICK|nr:hypothetical protein [Ehrlichia japonica]AHX04731.1 putative membrane protein [Ehrlichia japonica]
MLAVKAMVYNSCYIITKSVGVQAGFISLIMYHVLRLVFVLSKKIFLYWCWMLAVKAMVCNSCLLYYYKSSGV